MAEITFALRATQPLIAKPVLHLIGVVTCKANFQFNALRLAKSVGISECAQHQPTMQRRRAFRSERGDEAGLHLPGDGKAREQNQTASLLGHVTSLDKGKPRMNSNEHDSMNASRWAEAA